MYIGQKLQHPQYGTITVSNKVYNPLNNNFKWIGKLVHGREIVITQAVLNGLQKETKQKESVSLDDIASAFKVQKGVKGEKGCDGRPGKTPIAGIDYHTKAQVSQTIINELTKKYADVDNVVNKKLDKLQDGKDGIDGIKGNKGDTGKTGATGKQGASGKGPSKEELTVLIQNLIPEQETFTEEDKKMLLSEISNRVNKYVGGGGAHSWDQLNGTPKLADGTTGQVPALDANGDLVWTDSGGSGSGDMLKATYDPAGIEEQLAGLTATQELTNKTIDDYTNHIHADALHFRVKATEDIDKGQPVTITGWNVGESAYNVELANQATNVSNGLASTDMLNGEFGMIIQTGNIQDIDTSAFSEGSILYLDGTGILTETEPTTGFAQPIAYVVRSHAINGSLQVNADYPKQDAEDVRIDDTNDYYNSTEVEGALAEIGITQQQTGYDTLRPDTMPDLAFDNGTRTVSVSVKSGQSEFIFWTGWKKHTHTTTQTVVIPDVTAFYYIYFDGSGVLQYVEWTGTPDAAVYEYAITAGVRWNATQASGGLAEERHGIEKSSLDHKMEHDTDGARYANGMDIEGLASGSPTYTQTTYGEFWDEDIPHKTAVAGTHGWMYRLGALGEWTTATADNEVGHKDGADTYYSWNEWTGTTWQLTEGGVTSDYWITFFMAQPKYGGAVITKVMGQNAYANALTARNAIETELETMQLDGLPGPETVFLYAVIVKRDGTLVPDGDGNLIYDLRSVKGGASGGSATPTTAQDIATDTTDFDGKLSATDTNVQLALDTLDDHVHIASEVTDFDTEVANNTAVALNTAKETNIAHPLVETAVPTGALFTDTIYDDTTIQAEVDLNTAKNSYPTADETKLAGIETGAEVNNISDANATDLTDGGDTTLHDHDGISENTAARHTQGTDVTLGSGCVAVDHGTATTDQVINACYGTSATPPTASTTTEGTIYIQYTA